MTKDDMKPGLVVLIPDVDGEIDEVTIIGFDARCDAWVGSCKSWLMEVSLIDEDDYVAMEIKSV